VERLCRYVLVLLAIVLLVSCGEESGTQPAPTVAKSAKVARSAEAIAVVEAQEESLPEYVYNPLGKRDPFENPLRSLVEIATDDGVPLTPLQKYDLGQLRLIGVIIGKGDPRAMVIAPDGKSFILSAGTKIGKNNGSVVKITTESVQVKEKYFDFAGEVKTSIQEIKLPKQGGVK